jgi:hypothetical protein
MAKTKDYTDLKDQIFEDLDIAIQNEHDERARGQEDISFINGDQWPSDVVDTRRKRVKLTINKMPAFLDQIDGDLRLNKRGIKVQAVDSYADEDRASIISGLIKHIEYASNASRVYAYAGMHAAAGGRGAWRILAQYVDDITFQQEIRIQRIIDAYTVYYDPAAIEEDKQDGRFFFVVADMPKKIFEQTYKREAVDFNTAGTNTLVRHWLQDNTVRVAEYFFRKQVGTKTLYLLKTGEITNQPLEAIDRDLIQDRRDIPISEIWWTKLDGSGIIEEPRKIAGTMFPIVLVWGKELCVNGKLEIRGLARHAKDPQRMYNYWRSAHTELIALAPKQPYIMPDTVIGPYKEIWDKAASENYPYLPYAPDPNNPNLRPFKEPPTMPSSGMLQEIQLADRDLRDTVGIHKAALGMTSNETSGVAIARRESQSDTGQYAYIDNTLAAIQTSGRIIVNMIPDIYNTERTIRIIGEDAKEKLVRLGIQNLQDKIYDLSIGKYDVAIDASPSYATQREELVAKLQALLPSMPQEQIAIVTDILFDSLDMPGAAKIAERLKKLLPEHILSEDERIPKTEEQLQMEEEAKQQQAMQMQQAAELEQMKVAIEQLKLQTQQMKLQTEQAQIEQEQLKTAADTQIAKLRLDQETIRLQQQELELALANEEISDKIANALHEVDMEETNNT